MGFEQKMERTRVMGKPTARIFAAIARQGPMAVQDLICRVDPRGIEFRTLYEMDQVVKLLVAEGRLFQVPDTPPRYDLTEAGWRALGYRGVRASHLATLPPASTPAPAAGRG